MGCDVFGQERIVMRRIFDFFDRKKYDTKVVFVLDVVVTLFFITTIQFYYYVLVISNKIV